MPLTGMQNPSTDELIAWLADNLSQFSADEPLTPLTLTALHPNLGWTRAANALRSLHSAGLLYRTTRGSSVYAQRNDLPTSGTGHVWLRLDNRRGAHIEITADKPRLHSRHRVDQAKTSWTCTACNEGSSPYEFYEASKRGATLHADRCVALPHPA